MVAGRVGRSRGGRGARGGRGRHGALVVFRWARRRRGGRRRPPGSRVGVRAVLGGGLHIGGEAVVVGHPLGLVGSVSAGVISGLDRSVPLENGSTLDGLIQFDAAVNPGNSGGPLLDRDGRVVGIVAAL